MEWVAAYVWGQLRCIKVGDQHRSISSLVQDVCLLHVLDSSASPFKFMDSYHPH